MLMLNYMIIFLFFLCHMVIQCSFRQGSMKPKSDYSGSWWRWACRNVNGRSVDAAGLKIGIWFSAGVEVVEPGRNDNSDELCDLRCSWCSRHGRFKSSLQFKLHSQFTYRNNLFWSSVRGRRYNLRPTLLFYMWPAATFGMIIPCSWCRRILGYGIRRKTAQTILR